MDPLASAFALLALLAFSVSAWGWGRVTLAACGLDADSGLAYPVALGLAALAAAGGWLNLLGIAYPPALWVLLVGGWIAAGQGIRKRTSPPPWHLAGRFADRLADHAARLVPGGLIALTAVFLAFTLLPSAAFNPNDDFQLYFPRPVRMLQTGSLGRNPFDPIGFDSLGGYAFLQAFTLLAFPLRFLNAFDAVLAPVVALALVAALGKRLRLPMLVVLGALVVLVSVLPQQVNVSAVYAAAAFSLALVPAAARLFDSSRVWRSAVPMGLLLAALLGLKITTAVFLLPAGLLLLGAMAKTQGLSAALRSATAIVSWVAVFLASWVLLHAGKYAGWLAGGRTEESFGLAGDPTRLLSNAPLLWGGSVMSYNAVAALALAAALAGGVFFLRSPGARDQPALAPLASLCGGAALAYLVNAFPFDLDHAVRYSAPVLLAGGAAAILLLAHVLPRVLPLAGAVAVALALSAGIAVLFAGQTGERLHKALAYHTVLSYPPREIPKYTFMTGWGLDREVQEWVRRAQASTGAGEPVLALIACPYHLLFARNPVLMASELGISTPWIGLPLDADAAQIRRFLSERGVRYVIWQIGAGVQTDEVLSARLRRPYYVDHRQARNLLSFRHSLAELTSASKVLHVDDGLIVLDIAEKPQASPDSPKQRTPP